MPKTTAFITGATGFLGAHVARLLLQKGYRVRALKRPNSSTQLLGQTDHLEWVEGDVLDVFSLEDGMAGCDVVFHCAAIVSFDPRDARRMIADNEEGTANVVNTALHLGIRRFAHVSSIAAIGRAKPGQSIDESTSWTPSPLNSNYAISKYLSEQQVWRGAAEGLEVVVVNPSIIIGPGPWGHSSPSLFSKVWKGLAFYPLGKTGFVDVRDVALALVALAESGISQQRYILNADNWPYRMLFDSIADALGKKRPNTPVTPLLREVAWRVEWLKGKITGRRPLITKETARHSAHSYLYDGQKIFSALPDFQYRPLAQSIEDTAAIFKEGLKDGQSQARIFPSVLP